jgi:hypothetical protein
MAEPNRSKRKPLKSALRNPPKCVAHTITLLSQYRSRKLRRVVLARVARPGIAWLGVSYSLLAKFAV